MAIYWPTPGFKGRTFKLCVLTRWDFNFCVRSSPLRGQKTTDTPCSASSEKKRNYDIIGLQEFHISTAKEAEQWEMQWGGKLFYLLGTNHSLGHITLGSKSYMQNTQCIYHDDRIILLETSTNNSKLLIANIYAPQSPTDKIAFCNQIHNIMT